MRTSSGDRLMPTPSAHDELLDAWSVRSKSPIRLDSSTLGTLSDDEVAVIAPPRRLMKPKIQSDDGSISSYSGFGKELNVLLGNARKQLENHAKAVRELEGKTQQSGYPENPFAVNSGHDEERDPAESQSMARENNEARTSTAPPSYTYAEKAFLTMFAKKTQDPRCQSPTYSSSKKTEKHLEQRYPQPESASNSWHRRQSYLYLDINNSDGSPSMVLTQPKMSQGQNVTSSPGHNDISKQSEKGSVAEVSRARIAAFVDQVYSYGSNGSLDSLEIPPFMKARRMPPNGDVELQKKSDIPKGLPNTSMGTIPQPTAFDIQSREQLERLVKMENDYAPKTPLMSNQKRQMEAFDQQSTNGAASKKTVVSAPSFSSMRSGKDSTTGTVRSTRSTRSTKSAKSVPKTTISFSLNSMKGSQRRKPSSRPNSPPRTLRPEPEEKSSKQSKSLLFVQTSFSKPDSSPYQDQNQDIHTVAGSGRTETPFYGQLASDPRDEANNGRKEQKDDVAPTLMYDEKSVSSLLSHKKDIARPVSPLRQVSFTSSLRSLPNEQKPSVSIPQAVPNVVANTETLPFAKRVGDTRLEAMSSNQVRSSDALVYNRGNNKSTPVADRNGNSYSANVPVYVGFEPQPTNWNVSNGSNAVQKATWGNHEVQEHPKNPTLQGTMAKLAKLVSGRMSSSSRKVDNNTMDIKKGNVAMLKEKFLHSEKTFEHKGFATRKEDVITTKEKAFQAAQSSSTRIAPEKGIAKEQAECKIIGNSHINVSSLKTRDNQNKDGWLSQSETSNFNSQTVVIDAGTRPNPHHEDHLKLDVEKDRTESKPKEDKLQGTVDTTEAANSAVEDMKNGPSLGAGGVSTAFIENLHDRKAYQEEVTKNKMAQDNTATASLNVEDINEEDQSVVSRNWPWKTRKLDTRNMDNVPTSDIYKDETSLKEHRISTLSTIQADLTTHVASSAPNMQPVQSVSGVVMVGSLQAPDPPNLPNNMNSRQKAAISDDIVEEAIELELTVKDEPETTLAKDHDTELENQSDKPSYDVMQNKVEPQIDTIRMNDVVLDERQSSVAEEQIYPGKRKTNVLKRFFVKNFRKGSNSKSQTPSRVGQAADTLAPNLSESGLANNEFDSSTTTDNDSEREALSHRAAIQTSAGMVATSLAPEFKIIPLGIANDIENPSAMKIDVRSIEVSEGKKNKFCEPIESNHESILPVNTDMTSPQHSVMTYRAQLCIEEIQMHKPSMDIVPTVSDDVELFSALESPRNMREVQKAIEMSDTLVPVHQPSKSENPTVTIGKGFGATQVDLVQSKPQSEKSEQQQAKDAGTARDNSHPDCNPSQPAGDSIMKRKETSKVTKTTVMAQSDIGKPEIEKKPIEEAPQSKVGAVGVEENQMQSHVNGKQNTLPKDVIRVDKKDQPSQLDSVVEGTSAKLSKEDDGERNHQRDNTQQLLKSLRVPMFEKFNGAKTNTDNKILVTQREESKTENEKPKRAGKLHSEAEKWKAESANDGNGTKRLESVEISKAEKEKSKIENHKSKTKNEKPQTEIRISRIEKEQSDKEKSKTEKGQLKTDKEKSKIEKEKLKAEDLKQEPKIEKEPKSERKLKMEKEKEKAPKTKNEQTIEKESKTEKDLKVDNEPKPENVKSKKPKSTTEKEKQRSEKEKSSPNFSTVPKKDKPRADVKSNKAQSNDVKAADVEQTENSRNEHVILDLKKVLKLADGIQEKSKPRESSVKTTGLSSRKSVTTLKDTVSIKNDEAELQKMGKEPTFQHVIIGDDESIKIVGRTADMKSQENDANHDESSAENTSKKMKTKRKDGFFGFSRKMKDGGSKAKLAKQKNVSIHHDDNLSLSEVSMTEKMRVVATSDDEFSYTEEDPEVTNSFVRELLTPRGRLSVEQIARDAGIRTASHHQTTKKLTSPTNHESDIPSNIPRVISHISRPPTGNGSLIDDGVSEATSPSYLDDVLRKSKEKRGSRKSAEGAIHGRKTFVKYSIYEDGISVQASRHSTTSHVSKISTRTGKSKRSARKFRGTKVTDEEISETASKFSKAISKARKNKLDTDDVSLSPSIKSIQCSYDDELSDPYNEKNAGWGAAFDWLW